MKKGNLKKSILATFAGLLFIYSSGYAQTWNIPSAGSTSASYFGITSNHDLLFYSDNSEKMRLTTSGRLGIGTTTPSQLLEVLATGADSYIKVHRSGTMGAPYGTVGLLIGSTGSIGIASYPSYGSGTLFIDNGSSMINVTGSKVNFGGLPGAGYTSGDFNFNGETWTNSLAVAEASAPGPNPWSMPSGYTFAVKSDSYFEGKVGVGVSTFPSDAPSGGYKFALSGNANLNGSVVIGDPSTITATTPFPTGYKLFVTDGILTEKVKVTVKTTSDWSDFVFSPTYRLRPLAEVESYIQENKHLPDVPSAQEVVNNGVDVAKMDAVLLQKVEELTLYTISMNKKLEEMKEENEILKQEVEKLKQQAAGNN